MKIAIVGSGISGLTAAYLLNAKYDVTVFEAGDYIGGHTATKAVSVNDKHFNIDTGFIVYNDWTYPNFINLLDRLGVETQATSMGFSVFKKNGSFHYSGDNLSSLFAKRSLLLSFGHWCLLKDIVRFNAQAKKDWAAHRFFPGQTLGEYLLANNYSEAFRKHYLIPMGAAIWSSSTGDMMDFDVAFFVRFFVNHGLLNIFNRPTWRVVKGGSHSYVKPLIKSFESKIKLGEAVVGISRVSGGEAEWSQADSGDDGLSAGVMVNTHKAQYRFDKIIMACHSDQALSLLDDPTADELNVLGAIKYRKNQVTLHTDTQWLPASRKAWSSWNYCLSEDENSPPVVTYNMNILQGVKSEETFCVTLNAADKIDVSKVLGQYEYDHPVLTQEAVDAQGCWQSINGADTFYCGAYWFNGFHEDGVNSAIRVASALGVKF